MNRRFLDTAATAYASIFFLVGLVAFGPSVKFAVFVLLPAFFGIAIYCVAQSHLAAAESRERRRQRRAENQRRRREKIEPARPFQERLSGYVKNEVGQMSRSEDSCSHMPLKINIDLQQRKLTPPKTTSLIRRVLLQIRRLIRRSARA